MAFSFFGKKPPPEPAKPAARKAPATAKPAAKPAPPPKEEELESLDFTDLGGGIEVMTENSEAYFQIQESSATIHPVVEEVSVLFANGQDAAALVALEAGTAADNLGEETAQAWAMLFDLYQLMGKREAFERHALDYSVKFEKSPPTWVDAQDAPVDPALATGGQAFVAFSGPLGAGSDKTCKLLERVVSANPVARVEFTRVQSVDAAGAALLRKALLGARKARCELAMVGAEKLAALLQGRIEPGKRENEELWLLLLELYQQLGTQEPFEEWALQYAITFEVSPPWWENRPAPKKVVPAAQAEPVVADAFPLSGELCGAGSDTCQQLSEFAATRNPVVIDCAALKRMDFVCAGTLLNLLSGFAAAGKTVQIRRPNNLVLGLFGVLGIDQVAQVERRKF